MFGDRIIPWYILLLYRGIAWYTLTYPVCTADGNVPREAYIIVFHTHHRRHHRQGFFNLIIYIIIITIHFMVAVMEEIARGRRVAQQQLLTRPRWR